MADTNRTHSTLAFLTGLVLLSLFYPLTGITQETVSTAPAVTSTTATAGSANQQAEPMISWDRSALRDAIESGDFDEVKRLMEQGVIGNTVDFLGPFDPSAPALALTLGHREIAEYLLEKNIHPEKVDSTLKVAVDLEDPDLVRAIIRRYGLTTLEGSLAGYEILTTALANDNLAYELSLPLIRLKLATLYTTEPLAPILQRAIADNALADVPAICEAATGWSSEIIAPLTKPEFFEALAVVLDSCFNEFSREETEMILFSDAITRRDYALLDHLLSIGIPIDQSVSFGVTAVDVALQDNDLALLQALLDRDVSLDRLETWQTPYLNSAIDNEQTEIALLLIDAGTPTNEEEFETALYMATEHHNLPVYQSLLKHSSEQASTVAAAGEALKFHCEYDNSAAAINFCSALGQQETVDQHCNSAKETGSLETLEVCADLGLIQTADAFSLTALTTAFNKDDIDTAKRLLTPDVIANFTDEAGLGVVELAVQKGAYKIYQWLSEQDAQPAAQADESTLLSLAVEGQNLRLYEQIEQTIDDQGIRESALRTAFSLAAKYHWNAEGYLKILEHQRLADYPAPSDALHLAIAAGSMLWFETAVGRNISILTPNPATAHQGESLLLTLARHHERFDDQTFNTLLQKLLDGGLDINELNRDLETALSIMMASLNPSFGSIPPAALARTHKLYDLGGRCSNATRGTLLESIVSLAYELESKEFRSLIEIVLDGADAPTEVLNGGFTTTLDDLLARSSIRTLNTAEGDTKRRRRVALPEPNDIRTIFWRERDQYDENQQEIISNWISSSQGDEEESTNELIPPARFISSLFETQKDRIRFLIDLGANISTENASQLSSTLATFYEFEDLPTTSELIEAGIDASVPLPEGDNLLTRAVVDGRDEWVRALLASGVSPRGFRATDGRSALHLAVSHNRTDYLDWLIEAGADVDTRALTSEGKTPLMEALALNHIPLVKQLIDAGANPKQRDNNGEYLLSLLNDQSPSDLRQLIEGFVDTDAEVALYVSILRKRDSKIMDTSPDGMLTLRSDGTAIELWDETNQRAIRVVHHAEEGIGGFDEILLAEFLDDRELLVLRAYEEKILIVDAYSGRVLRTLYETENNTGISEAVISADQSLIGFVSDGGTSILRVKDGSLVRQEWGFDLSSLKFSDDGEKLFAIFEEDLITHQVNQVDSPTTRFSVFSKDSFEVPEFAAVNNQGLLLVTPQENEGRGNEALLLLVDAKSQTHIGRLDTNLETIVDVAFSPDGKRFFTQHRTDWIGEESITTIAAWDSETRELIWKRATGTMLGYDHTARVDHNGDLYFINQDRQLNKLSGQDGSLLFQQQIIVADELNFALITLHDDTVLLASANTLQRWQFDRVGPVGSLEFDSRIHLVSNTATKSSTIKSSNQYAVHVLTEDGVYHTIEINSLDTAKFQDKTKPSEVDTLVSRETRKSPFGDGCLNTQGGKLVLQSNGSVLLTCWDAGILKWSGERNEVSIANIETFENLSDVAISPNGELLISVNATGYPIRFYDPQSLILSGQIGIYKNTRSWTSALAVNGETGLVGSYRQSSLRFIDLTTGETLHNIDPDKLAPGIQGATFSENGEIAITWAAYNVQLWRVSDGQLLNTLSINDEIISLALSKDGKYFALSTGRDQYAVTVFSVDSGKPLTALRPIRSPVLSLDFSSNNALLALGSRNVEVWNINDNKIVERYNSSLGLVRTARFTQQDRFLAVAREAQFNDEGTAHLMTEVLDRESGETIKRIEDATIRAVSNTGALLLSDSDDQLSIIDREFSERRLPIYTPKGPEPKLFAVTHEFIYSATERGLYRTTFTGQKREYPIESWDLEHGYSDLKMYYSEGLEWAAYQSMDGLSVFKTAPPREQEGLRFDKHENSLHHTGTEIGCFNGKLNAFSDLRIDTVKQVAFVSKPDGSWYTLGDESDNCVLTPAKAPPDGTALIAQIDFSERAYEPFDIGAHASLTARSEDQNLFAFATEDKLKILDLGTGQILPTIKTPAGIGAIALNRDGSLVAIYRWDDRLSVYATASGEVLFSAIPTHADLKSVSFHADTVKVVTERVTKQRRECNDYLCDRIDEALELATDTYSLPSGELIGTTFASTTPETKIEQESLVLSDGSKIEIEVSAELPTIDFYERENGNAVKSPSGKFIATGIDDDLLRIISNNGQVLLEKASDGTYRRQFKHVAFLQSERFAFVVQRNGEITLLDLATGDETAYLRLFDDNRWVVFDAAGRYDSSTPGDLPSAAWVADDARLTALPVEVFMREYFEPRLLNRILEGEQFAQVMSIANLNRTQPSVDILSVKQEGNTASIELALTNKTPNNPELKPSGLGEVRVFRDNQLVAWLPESDFANIDAGATVVTTIEDIQLPTAADTVAFSAYAFNSDDVKSPTKTATLNLEKKVDISRASAFVIAIGANEYENPSWNLTYAAADAKAISEQIQKSLDHHGQFDEVVTISLISGDSVNVPSKASILAVLDVLAGRTADNSVLSAIEGNDRLRKAKPDDLIMIAFAGHGLAGTDGDFYLFPWDIGDGNGRQVTDELYRRLLSSSELDYAMRDIDAAEFLMIIDACNSAASVEGNGFKPGPMGSRGLGQLAYNKGMRVLTASEAEAVALESDALKHGLLTYALIEEGLREERADQSPRNNAITSRELLTFGANRVPELHRFIEGGEEKLPGSRGARVKREKQAETYVQRPALFDFSPASRNTVIHTINP